MRVVDESRLSVPDDGAYDFIGAESGTDVWVIPQTQNPDVVWLGWNTQDPEVMERIDRGVTMSLSGVQGPGTMTVYLQSGAFGEPDVLWDSRSTDDQPAWVDVNTHTHANWVFTQPGVYLVRLTISATLIDGSEVTDTQILRFAVGSQTPVDDAFDAVWSGGDIDEQTSADTATGSSDDGGVVAILVAAVVIVTLALIVGFALVVLRARRAHRQVVGMRTQDGS